MSPTRSGYKELGLELVKPLQDQHRKSKWSPMANEKKDEGVGDPIKILLEEVLEQQRNAMMDKFSQILQRLPRGNKLYRIPKVALPTTISLVTAKQCSKLISKTEKFFFLMICPQGKKKTAATTSR